MGLMALLDISKGVVMLMYTKKRFLSAEDGQDLIEWALLAAFIAMVVVLMLFLFREPLLGVYQGILDTLNFMNNNL